jgi:5'-3' exonuclease
MDVHLVDGTYELFRHYYALPSARDQDGHEVAAVRGVLRSVLGMIRGGATHIAVATDHAIESFRNGLWAGYKMGERIEPDLLAQFGPWWSSKPMTHSQQRQLPRLRILVWTG